MTIRRAAAASVVAGLMASAMVAAPAGAAEDPFARARAAAGKVSFTGTLEVRWRDGATEHTEQVSVQSGGGTLLFRGGNQVLVSSSSERLIQHEGGGWNLLWPPVLDRADAPDPGAKYQTVEHTGAAVAGRPTTVVEVRQRGLLREEVALDRDTDLLLERRQFDATGAVTRVVGFTALVVDPATAPPASPGTTADRAPEVVPATSLLSHGMAPAVLADGYARLGVYKRDGTVQVLYSDGIYELSVFERAGALDRGELSPAAGKVQVGTSDGWRYAWPGGQVVLWQAGPTVYTLVSDAPLDQVLTAARDLPVPAARKPSSLERLRAIARTIIQPLE